MGAVVSVGVTMSSRDIAELVEARHNDVTATIQRLFSKGLLRSSRETRQEQTGGRPVDVYDLVERDCYLIVSGYSDELRARVIDRWQELERRGAQVVDPLQALMDPAVLRSLLLGYSQKVEGLASTIALQAPKVAAFDRFATVTDGTYSLRESAKSLQVKPKWLIGWMVERRWIYRHPDGGRWLAFQPRIDSGLLEHKVVTGQRNDGTDWGTTQVRVTAKGLARIAELLDRERAEGN